MVMLAAMRRALLVVVFATLAGACPKQQPPTTPKDPVTDPATDPKPDESEDAAAPTNMERKAPPSDPCEGGE